mmetsp:Transcript_160139/g.282418  ORF Transcript_160139/g.282418 Transcript_160139/m.282418 type:complete len:486 (+) Transcript_160139:82-1539(+)
MVAREADARTALQKLFGSSNLPQQKPASATPAEQAGMALRHLFRAEIQKALHPPKAATRMEEMHGQISRLLDQVAPADKMETNQDGAQTQSPKSGMSFRPPERKGRAAQMVDIAAQTDPLLTPMRFVDPPANEIPPQEELQPEGARRLKLVFQENNREAENLRNNVKQARSRLQVLDAETTRLTRELKLCRKSLWEQQREQSNTDGKISSIIAQRAADLDEEQGKELVRLEEEERSLAQELSEARQVAGKWSNIARRQEEMLKQERDQAKEDDVHKILLRHPAGEVFLPPMLPNDGSDDMSDDEYYRDAPRGPFRGRRDEEEPTLASSDEDDYRPQQDRTPPPPPTQQWRAPLSGDADKESEGASTVTSPSGSESLRGSPQAADAGRGRMLGAPGAPANTAAASAAPANTADSDSDSEDDFLVKSSSNSKPTANQEEKPREAMKTTPPLPGLSGGLGARSQMPNLSADSAEEISSEEGLDTSRSV